MSQFVPKDPRGNQHVVAPMRLLREVTYFIADSQLVDLWMSRLTLLVTDNTFNTYVY